MTWSWFDAAFPWIGGAAALVILVLLFGTSLFRSQPALSRWRDPVWLSWCAAVIYLLHNVEEYGLDLRGRTLSFPNMMCSIFNFHPYPNCPIPPAFFLAVNIPLFWIVGPIAALLSPRHRLMGLALYSVISINGFIHAAATFVVGYNAGLLTALLLFIPFTIWGGRTFFGKDGLSYKVMAFVIGWGVILHAILAIGLGMFINGLIGPTALVLSQIFNAGLLLLIFWLGQLRLGNALARSF
jgi:hypothetical protein